MKQPTPAHRWYVYAYVDPRPEKDGAVIYVGKGTHEGRGRLQRMEEHWASKSLGNKLFSNVLAKIRGLGLEPVRMVLGWYDEEVDAYVAEMIAIMAHGLREEGGTLCNLTYGGEGILGYAHTKKTKKNIGAHAKIWWADPKYVAKWAEAIKKGHARADVKAAKSDVGKARWADPKFKEKTSAAIGKAKSTPEARQQTSVTMKAVAQSPEFRLKASMNAKAARSTPEARAATSKQIKALWADPQKRESMLAARAAARAKKTGMLHTSSVVQ